MNPTINISIFPSEVAETISNIQTGLNICNFGILLFIAMFLGISLLFWKSKKMKLGEFILCGILCMGGAGVLDCLVKPDLQRNLQNPIQQIIDKKFTVSKIVETAPMIDVTVDAKTGKIIMIAQPMKGN